jgi:hypothetical protein
MPVSCQAFEERFTGFGRVDVSLKTYVRHLYLFDRVGGLLRS